MATDRIFDLGLLTCFSGLLALALVGFWAGAFKPNVTQLPVQSWIPISFCALGLLLMIVGIVRDVKWGKGNGVEGSK